MINLPLIIEYIAHLNGIERVNFMQDVRVFDTDSGPEIREWRLPFDLPTTEECQQHAEAAELWRQDKDADAHRERAYKQEADALFFKSQRGEIPLQAWLDKVEEIRLRFPKSTDVS